MANVCRQLFKNFPPQLESKSIPSIPSLEPKSLAQTLIKQTAERIKNLYNFDVHRREFVAESRLPFTEQSNLDNASSRSNFVTNDSEIPNYFVRDPHRKSIQPVMKLESFVSSEKSTPSPFKALNISPPQKSCDCLLNMSLLSPKKFSKVSSRKSLKSEKKLRQLHILDCMVVKKKCLNKNKAL